MKLNSKQQHNNKITKKEIYEVKETEGNEASSDQGDWNGAGRDMSVATSPRERCPQTLDALCLQLPKDPPNTNQSKESQSTDRVATRHELQPAARGNDTIRRCCRCRLPPPNLPPMTVYTLLTESSYRTEGLEGYTTPGADNIEQKTHKPKAQLTSCH